MPFWTGRRAVGGILLLVVLIALTWAAVVVAVAIQAAHDEATGADAIAVLGAAQYNGRPSPVFRARLDHAATLYQRGLAPVVRYRRRRRARLPQRSQRRPGLLDPARPAG